MVVVGSADALQVSRLMLDTPAHEAIRRFSGVNSIEDYLQRRADFFGQTAHITAVRLRYRPGTIPGVQQEPPEQTEGKYIFVIMPLKSEFDDV